MSVARFVACYLVSAFFFSSTVVSAQVDPQKFLYTFELDRTAGERFQPEDTLESEQREYQRLIDLFTQHFKKNYSTPTSRAGHSDQGEQGYALRAVHAKGHGCLIGTFSIEDHQATEYRHSIFATPDSHQIVARFSNGDGPPVKDGDRTISIGLAFKVLDVHGAKLLKEQTEASIDFLMTNHPGFVAKNIADFAEVIEGRESGLLEKLGALWVSGRGLFKRLLVAKEDPLVTSYWGNLPFKLGDQVVKYLIRPEPCIDEGNQLKVGEGDPVKVNVGKDPHFLSAALDEHMRRQNACFGFYLQKKGTDFESPVEDATVAWPERKGFLVRVGEVKFPIQSPNELLSKMNLPGAAGLNGKQICQHLAFSPWNTTADFKPLSSLNRARRVIYELSVALRREINQSGNPAETRQ